MIDCPNCNRFYDDNFDFCPYCGTKKPSPKICPNCEISTYATFSFCPKCGTELISELEFNEAWGYIDNLIDNEGYDGALAKYEELIDEMQFNKNLKETFKNYIQNNKMKQEKELTEKIEKYFDSFEYEKALIYINKAIGLKPSDEELRENKAFCLVRLRRHEEAIEYIEKIMEQYSLEDNYYLWKQKGFCLSALGKYEEAIEAYDKSIEIYPLDDLVWKFKSICFSELGMDEKAKECNDKALEVEQSIPSWSEMDGDIRVESGEYEKAIEYFSKAKAEYLWKYGYDGPGYERIMVKKGKCLEKLGKYEEALECYEKLIKINPSNHEYRNGKDSCLSELKKYWEEKAANLLELKKYEEAVECYYQALEYCNIDIELNQEDFENHIMEREILEVIRIDEESAKLYNKALELNPNDKENLRYGGLILDKLGKKEEALEFYNRLIELEPENSFYLYLKEKILEELEEEERKTEFRKMVIEAELNPSLTQALTTIINENKILDKNELKEEITKRKLLSMIPLHSHKLENLVKNGSIKTENMLKLILIIENSSITFANKEIIEKKVLKGEIIEKSSLIKTIEETQKEENINYAKETINEIDIELPNAKKRGDDILYVKLLDEKIEMLKEIIENGKGDEEVLNEINKTIKEKSDFEESKIQEEIYYLEKRIMSIDKELPNAIDYNGRAYVSMLFNDKIKLLQKILEYKKDDENILNEIDKTIKVRDKYIGIEEKVEKEENIGDKYCIFCGSKLSPKYPICPNCGKKLTDEKKVESRKYLEKEEEIDEEEYLTSLDEKIESLEKLYLDEKDNNILNEINKIIKEKENFIERRR